MRRGAEAMPLGEREWLAYTIESQREERAALQLEIEQQQATVRELEKKTWGVGLAELENGRCLLRSCGLQPWSPLFRAGP